MFSQRRGHLGKISPRQNTYTWWALLINLHLPCGAGNQNSAAGPPLRGEGGKRFRRPRIVPGKSISCGIGGGRGRGERGERTSSSSRRLSSCSSSSSSRCATAFSCMLSEPWNRLSPGPASMPRASSRSSAAAAHDGLTDAFIVRSILLFITP